MKKRWLLVWLLPLVALGQSVPNGTIIQGQVWTAAQWNTAWQSKQDFTTPRQTTATANQTVFSLPPGMNVNAIVFVALDGVILYPTTDYTVGSTTLTLANGALAGQVLMVR